MTDAIIFSIEGEPAPQGSKVRTKYAMREDNPRTRPWRDSVAWNATAVMRSREPLDCPVVVEIVFAFARPSSHFGTGKNEGHLKNSAPIHHRVKPDLDKLCRAILDGMSGIVIRDDSRVVELRARKEYGRPGAKVIVRPA